MRKNVHVCALMTVLVASAARAALAASQQEERPGDGQVDATTSGRPKELMPLVVVGFHADEKKDSRDAWIPTAVEETLAWRLRRVPGLTVTPTTRAHQARRELAENGGDSPAEWSRVARLLGAERWLKGRCAGTPDALALSLELIRVGCPDAEAARIRLGPGRLFGVIDEATRWTLSRLGITRIGKKAEELVFAPPSASPSALEYYAKGLSAARRDDLRDGAYYVEQAIEYDPGFCPALMLMTKIELRSSGATRARAGGRLRRIKQLAADRGDALTEAEFERIQGLLLLMRRSFDAARQRFESALATAFERDDLYGQIAAMNSLCDLWLNYEPSTRGELSADALRRLNEQNLRRAAEWQALVLDMLRELGDVIAEVPAANKLALIYERLDESLLALEAHKQTVAAARETGSRRSEATGWLFLGQWYQRRERWREALEATSRCLALATDEAKPRVRIALAEVYRGMSLPREALGQYELAYEALASGDDLLNQFRCLRAAADLRMELGDRGGAIKGLAEALDIAQVLGLAEAATVRERLAQWRSEKP
ncbi:MAG: hypothetical protein ACE5I3_12400 [Phycisphaerae bacterium]